MSHPGDLLIGKIALREGFLTREQLYDCLQSQERNPAHTLGAIMVQRGYLRKEDVPRLLDLQKTAMDPPSDGSVSHRTLLFGRLLVEEGLATEYQVNEGLRLQGRLAEMGIRPVPLLGEILIRRGYLKPEAVETALQMQNLSLYACPECGASIEISAGALPAAQYTCRSCGIEVPLLFAKMAASARHALDRAADQHDIETPDEVRDAVGDSKTHFGKYILLREIGRGGTGIVYRAWQKDLNKIVALKLLPHESDTAAGVKTPYGDAEDVKRFYNETRAAADLKHENIVPVLDFGNVDNHFYFTMPLIDGITFDEIIHGKADAGRAFRTTLVGVGEFAERKEAPDGRAQGLSASVAFRLMLPLVRAAAFAHSRGISHRDVKPGNIIVDRNGHPWLMDFGLAKVAKIGDSAYVKGVIMGTPYYMPPEQAEGDMERVDHLSDIYSLGAVLYEAVAGCCPYSGKSADEVLDLIDSKPPAPVRSLVPSIPEDAARVIEKAMRRLKRDRYPDASAMAEDMRLFLDGLPLQTEPTGARPVGLMQRVRKMFGGGT